MNLRFGSDLNSDLDLSCSTVMGRLYMPRHKV